MPKNNFTTFYLFKRKDPWGGLYLKKFLTRIKKNLAQNLQSVHLPDYISEKMANLNRL